MAGGVALCVALAPGTAWAEDEPTTPTPPEVVAELPEGEQGGEGRVGPQSETQEAEGEQADETPDPPAFEIPPEVVAALQQFAEQAGFSEKCVTGVTESLEQIVNGIAGLPVELQELLTDLGTAVQEQIAEPEGTALEDFLSGVLPAPPEEGSEEAPTPPIGADITAGLEHLVETLEEDCKPAPPTEQPPTQNPPQQPPASYQPPQAPAAPAPQAPVQPAVYPGYAPTGAEEVEGGPSTAALGLALMALAGGAVWTGRRWRAARPD